MSCAGSNPNPNPNPNQAGETRRREAAHGREAFGRSPGGAARGTLK